MSTIQPAQKKSEAEMLEIMCNEEKARKDLKPVIDVATAKKMAVSDWLMSDISDVKELESYDDRNFYMKGSVNGGPKAEYVFKVSNGNESFAHSIGILHAQNLAMKHLLTHGFTCPQPIPNREGQLLQVSRLPAKVGGGENDHGIRLLTYVAGELMCEVKDQKNSLLESLGSYIGKIDTVLANFCHPATKRLLLWDVSKLLCLRQFVQHISDPNRVALAEMILDRFEKEVTPVVDTLPQHVLHNDPNDHNVIVDKSRANVVAVLDFGDMVVSARINELAITVAYAILEKKNILQAAKAVIQGYTKECPITHAEQSLLHTLTCSRLCQSAIMSAYSFSKDPSNLYLLETSEPGWKALKGLSDMTKAEIEEFNNYCILADK